MSNYPVPVRSFNLTDAQLIATILEKTAFATRDATELLTVGVSPAWVLALKNQALTFAAMPDDDVELGEQLAATADKDAKAEVLRDKLKDLRSAVIRYFTDKSGTYKQFKLKGIDEMTEAELLKTALVAAGVANIYATELATKGYLATDILALKTLADNYVDSFMYKNIEVGSRDTAQEKRVMEANVLYNMLQNELCEAGKSYWRTRSAAMYNDYEIYTGTGTGNDPEVNSIDFVVLPGLTTKIIELPYVGTRTYKVTNTGNNPFSVLLSLDGVTGTGTKIEILPTETEQGTFANLAPAGNFMLVQNNMWPSEAKGTLTYSA